MPERKPDGRSKKRPGVDAQRRLIAEAAVDLFVAQGTAAVSISQICASADVSRPTFYRCFADKPALVAHIYELAVHDAVVMNLAAVLPEGRVDVRAELDAMIDRILEQPAMAAFVFVESADRTSPAHTIVRERFAATATQLEAWYRERGRTPPPRMTLEATMAACQWIVHETIRHGASPARRTEAKQAMWELVQGVFGLTA